MGDPHDTVAFILSLDAINFGSGYFPYLEKRPGLSGYFTVATSLKELWEQSGALDARQLSRLNAAESTMIGDTRQPPPENLDAEPCEDGTADAEFEAEQKRFAEKTENV